MVPGCDRVWGSAGEPSVCLSVCLSACSGWVAACWLFLVLSKERRRGRATHPGDHHEIYDIGTKILYFQCFVTTDMFLFCKPIFFSGNCRICRDLAFGSGKTRFKAILKKQDFSVQIDFLQLFGEICRQKMPKVSKVKK